MAASDYIFCKSCCQKYIYIGSTGWGAVDSIESRHPLPENEDYDNWLTCPKCVAKLEAENAELKAKIKLLDEGYTGE